MAGLPTTAYAVLGLLSWGPRSPYDLAQFAAQSIANFWNISKSQVYGEVERLAGLGYIEGEAVEQQGAPDKTIYKMTPSGEDALDTWLADPSFDPQRFRSGFLVKVFFGHRMPDHVLEELINRSRREWQSAIDQLRPVVERVPSGSQFRYAFATARLGLKMSEAGLAWADETLRELAQTRRKKK